MRLARKLMLLAAVAAAAMALSATSAFAEPVEVVDNNNGGAHCPDVVADDHDISGGCHVQAVSEHTVELEADVSIFHIHQADCHNTFEVFLDGAGNGFVTNFVIEQGAEGDEDCGGNLVRECEEAEAHGGGNGPWPTAAEETANGVTTGTITVCLETNNSFIPRCEGAFNVAITETNGDYEATAVDQGIGSSPCEVSGHWNLNDIEGTDVAVVHAP